MLLRWQILNHISERLGDPAPLVLSRISWVKLSSARTCPSSTWSSPAAIFHDFRRRTCLIYHAAAQCYDLLWEFDLKADSLDFGGGERGIVGKGGEAHKEKRKNPCPRTD